MMPSVWRDRICVSDRSPILKRCGIVLTIAIIAVAAFVKRRDRAADVHEVRDGTQAAGVREGISRWAIDTVRDY